MVQYAALTRKSRYHIACAVLRNPKDGQRWKTVHHNGFALAEYLAQVIMDVELLCEIYRIPKTLIEKESHAK